MNVRSLGVTAVLALIAWLPVATPAQASLPDTGFRHSVTPVGTISLHMTATRTTYVVSTMRVNDATIHRLIDVRAAVVLVSVFSGTFISAAPSAQCAKAHPGIKFDAVEPGRPQGFRNLSCVKARRPATLITTR